jgi:Na+-driven multidrug efflux pump
VTLAVAWGSRGAALAFSLAEALSLLTFAMLIRRRHRPSARTASRLGATR